MTAETIVQRQLDFYNQHDLEGFLSTYHESIQIRRLADQSLIMEGLDTLRERYGKRFLEAKPNARIHNRIVLGRQVIDEEHVTSQEFEGTKKVVAIYEVEQDQIIKVWFLYDE